MNRYFKFLTALLFFAASISYLHAQDLTGTWEATQNVNNKKYNLSLFLAKTPNGYVGITVIKEATTLKINLGNVNINNLGATRINVNSNAGDKKGNAQAEMIGSFNNGTFNYSDVGVIGEATLNVKLETGAMSYSKVKGKEKLQQVNNPANLEFTKKNGVFPDEYTPYRKDLIDVTSVKFTNGEKTAKVKYNDRGLLSFSVTNNSDFDLQRINISLHIREKEAQIQGLDGNNGTFSLARSKSLNPEIDIFSGFDLPADSIHFTVVGSFNNVPLFTRVIALPTIPFYLTDKTTVNKSSDQILSVVRPYYGLNKAPWAPIAAPLNQLILGGSNKLAPMWKAAFLSIGKGGYGVDEEAAMPLAQKAYKDVLSAARNGDAEAQYLMFYAVGLGLTGDPSRSVAGAFLKRSADAGFPPAMYDYSMYLLRDSLYDETYRYLMNAYGKGVQKAASMIGYFNQKGYATDKDFSKAIEWYNKGDAFGDPEAMMKLARIYNISDGEHQADPKKVVLYATKAANLKDVIALNYLAKIYLNGRSGIPKNIPKGLSLYKEAAALGDNASMSSMAYLYLNGAPGIPKDEKTAMTWAKRSAEAGGADCMLLLADMYNQGTITTKDIIKARFWENQARLHGVGEADNTARQASSNDMINILSNIDLSDHYSAYQSSVTGNIYEVNEGPDLIGGLFSSFMGAYKDRKANQQAQINGMEYMYASGHRKIYGGTISSKVTTSIMVNEGQKVKILGYGSVNLGMIAGVGGPDGVAGFQSYCIDPTLPHGAIMVKVGSKWSLAGSSRTFIAPSDGVLQFAINDVEAANNKGYFDIVVVVE